MSGGRRRDVSGDDPHAGRAHATPLTGRNFAVRITDVDERGRAGREWDLPCSEVVLPPFRVGERGRERDEPDVLTLRRGHVGSPELYDWWSLENDPEYHGSRNVAVTVLDDDLRAVTGWLFTGCHLHALRYSPLDALTSPVLLETGEVTFAGVTQHKA